MSLEIEDASKLPNEFIVFYSWQSQLPRKTNFTFIANSLRTAISKIESELSSISDCSIVLDRDTSGRSGSPDIANTIFEKVSRCHLFIGDVSIVKEFEDRAYCNNNVLIELGFAAGKLGWSRVSCVCNTSFGDIEMLPFDIRSRRVLKYEFAEGGDKRLAASQLDHALYLAIASCLESISRGEADADQSLESLKRKRDLHVLQKILRNIHRPTFDRFFHDLTEVNFLCDFEYFWYGLAAVVNSSSFQFYDPKLKELTLNFCEPLGQAFSDAALIFGPGPNSVWYTPRSSSSYEHDVAPILNKMFTAQANLQKLLDYVHENYPEIDFNDTDKLAWEENEPYINGSILESRINKDDTEVSEDE
tara:strand:+ start:2187 stop:3269 length:1083 start_codon:yes stop_codon:yes gene_type:complete